MITNYAQKVINININIHTEQACPKESLIYSNSS